MTQHMVEIPIPIGDVRSSYLSKDTPCSVWIRSPKSLCGNVEAFGIDQLYQEQNLSGCAMAGHYIQLNFPDHLKNIF